MIHTAINVMFLNTNISNIYIFTGVMHISGRRLRYLMASRGQKTRRVFKKKLIPNQNLKNGNSPISTGIQLTWLRNTILQRESPLCILVVPCLAAKSPKIWLFWSEIWTFWKLTMGTVCTWYQPEVDTNMYRL